MESATRQHRILVLEDRPEIRGALVELLATNGYSVESAANGTDALAQMRRVLPDLILLDRRMPAFEGWRFRLEQKRDPALAFTPVVVFSATPLDDRTLLENIELTLRTAPPERLATAPEEPAATGDPFVGRELPGGWRLIKRMGGGGMGAVYQAERYHTGVKEQAAVKMVHSQATLRPEALERFTTEARAIALLDHANIVRAHDVGCTEDGIPFLVLELLEGNTLAEEVVRTGPLPIGRAVRIARQIAAGLAAAHARDIIHRDVKPGNVFLCSRPRDFAKILDFGVSKFLGTWSGSHTQTGEMLGTPNYMAPEQLNDARGVDERTDIYGLGATLYELLAGAPPFCDANFPVLFLTILTERAPSLLDRRPDAPPALAATVERALAKTADSRWQTMREFSDALAPFTNIDDEVRVLPMDTARATDSAAIHLALDTARHAKPARRSALFMAATTAVLLLAGFGVYMNEKPASVSLLNPDPRGIIGSVRIEIEGPEIGATAKVRGELFSLPLRHNFKPSSEREPIEIVAPGREGRRFWLVLDHPRRLWIDLPRGQGVVDATDLEIESALDDERNRARAKN